MEVRLPVVAGVGQAVVERPIAPQNRAWQLWQQLCLHGTVSNKRRQPIGAEFINLIVAARQMPRLLPRLGKRVAQWPGAGIDADHRSRRIRCGLRADIDQARCSTLLEVPQVGFSGVPGARRAGTDDPVTIVGARSREHRKRDIPRIAQVKAERLVRRSLFLEAIHPDIGRSIQCPQGVETIDSLCLHHPGRLKCEFLHQSKATLGRQLRAETAQISQVLDFKIQSLSKGSSLRDRHQVQCFTG